MVTSFNTFHMFKCCCVVSFLSYKSQLVSCRAALPEIFNATTGRFFSVPSTGFLFLVCHRVGPSFSVPDSGVPVHQLSAGSRTGILPLISI